MYKTSHTDTVLELLKKGDRKTQKSTYEKFFPDMISIPLKYVGSKDEAFSILNEAFYRVFKSIHSYSGKGSFSGWIATIVFNTTIDHIRKNTNYKKHNILQDLPDVSITKSEALSNLSLNEIYKHIQDLPENERTIFSMYAIDGYKHKEIATLLDIPVGTSKWYLNVARKKLQEKLKREGYEQA